jgi:putative Ca2+/H+ antiporter (TMEM165/GDT1 family)
MSCWRPPPAPPMSRRLVNPQSTIKMNWQLLSLTFVTVFIAEIGDKSQLAAIALGGSSQHPRAVFFGSVVALLLASAIGVLAGGEMAAFLPTKILKGLAAFGFALMALRLLWIPDSIGKSE